MATSKKARVSANPLDGLDTYNAKRDFSRTAEPAGDLATYGRPKASGETLLFMVQKHAATRLHYDFRLEFNGVLLSWAVTKGPSPDPSQKRLAVRTEDHPLSYATFEGTIPKGEYGGGTVMLWDQGTWEPIGDPKAGLKKGKLEFRLSGQRMQGGWVLVRMRVKEKTTRENWLLIKSRDEFAVDEADSLTESFQVSITTQRSMDDIAANVAAPARKTGGRQASPSLAAPDFSKPQLATLAASAPEGDGWLNEAKFDGYRLLCSIGARGSKRSTHCFTRSGKDWTAKFPSIADALSQLDCRSALIDGEVIAAGDNEGSDFSALQGALSAAENGAAEGVEFMAFDLLEIDGEDWRNKPQIERKERLRQLLRSTPANSPIRFSEHILGSGPEVFKALCANGREGIIAKQASASYRGTRSKSWLKIKCSRRQEFVIAGFSPSDKPGRPFASLLVGSYLHGKLIYHGRIGTGFSATLMDDLYARMTTLRRKTSPFESRPGPESDPVPTSIAKTAQWLTPKLVVEIEFAELTDGGHIRHGVFQGVREDKPARDVHFEQAEAAVQSSRQPKARVPQKKVRPEHAKMKQGSNDNHEKQTVQGITLTNPDRVLFPDQGLTKLDLASYYEAVADRMLPLISDYPLSLVRCPSGRSSNSKRCFFQKHASDGFPEALHTLPITENSGKDKDYLYLSDAAGLVAGVQMGTLEYHIWGAKRDRLEKPARLVFDLDPDEGLDFEAVKDAAALVRGGLQVLGLESLPLVTGGKGIHVVVPLRRTAEWPQVNAFAKAFAMHLVAQFPERYTATMSKKKRVGKLFLDYFRNDRGSTAIAPYSTRARAGAPVATPVSWEELDKLDTASTFSPASVIERLKHADPWAKYEALSQSVTKDMLERLNAETV
ncbi:DNA ligase D [Allohahella marinimesophila]|uniref:DNA ligase (ATP) n=1 Tax=Allohahella marinimesophila TaxID=1054972 RepID=A0ABP7PFK1_9GAMM